MTPPLLADPYKLYATSGQVKDPVTELVPLLEEASLHELVAQADNEEAARRETKAWLALVNVAFYF